ncbi:MAG TPA: hypothetical protein VNA22_03275 [Pyrinomonadaceae bacterium]|nr:hypothetical protein [Pyrinomonadaceae bacterium]
MVSLTEAEFSALVNGIDRDRESILRHNPIGTAEEILLWMLMSCLVSYLSLDAAETPCFNGRPNQETYREAIRFILLKRKAGDFDAEPYLDKLAQ